MATTYCDYYGSVGATGYQSYHGCVTAPPIDPGDINNTCSIEPTSLGEVARIDQGATWWCDYSWTFGGAAVDLANYRVTASFYYPDGTLFTTIDNAAKLGSQFRLKLTDETTDTLEFGGEDYITLTIDIDLERINTNDPITGYIVGDVVRISAGCVEAYRRGVGALPPQDGATCPAIGEFAKTICIRTTAGVPIAGVEVFISTDDFGRDTIAGPLVSDSAGNVSVLIDAGKYYLWRRGGGHNFPSPVRLIVTADDLTFET